MQHLVNIASASGQSRLQLFGLTGAAGEAVEDEAVIGVDGHNLVQHDVNDHVVRHQLAPVHVLLGPEAQRRSLAQIVAEDVARTDVGQVVALHQQLRLGAFASPGRAEQHESQTSGHGYLKNPS